MKKFLFIHGSADAYGSAKILLQINQILVRRSVHPIVILPHHGSLVESLIELGVEVYIINIGVLRRRYFTPWGIIGRLFLWLYSSLCLYKLIRKKGVDIIYINSLNVVIGPVLKKLSGKLLYWHIHEIVESPSLLNKFLRLLLASADKLIAVSKATKQFWENGSQRLQIELLYNGIDHTSFGSYDRNDSRERLLKGGLKEGDHLIGMIGRVQAWKGQTYFIDIMHAMFTKHPEMKEYCFAVIVGDPYPGYEDLFDKMRQKIKKLQLDANIFCLGFRSDIPAILSALDLFVLPSTSPDPLPTVVLEAMASSKPVLATRQGGAVEMIEEGITGDFIPIDDVLQSADILHASITNKAALLTKGEHGRSRVMLHFSHVSFEQNWLRICLL